MVFNPGTRTILHREQRCRRWPQILFAASAASKPPVRCTFDTASAWGKHPVRSISLDNLSELNQIIYNRLYETFRSVRCYRPTLSAVCKAVLSLLRSTWKRILMVRCSCQIRQCSCSPLNDLFSSGTRIVDRNNGTEDRSDNTTAFYQR